MRVGWEMVTDNAPEFYWSEAERLLRMASATVDRRARVKLLELALLYRQMATDLESRDDPRAVNANTYPRDHGKAG